MPTEIKPGGTSDLGDKDLYIPKSLVIVTVPPAPADLFAFASMKAIATVDLHTS